MQQPTFLENSRGRIIFLNFKLTKKFPFFQFLPFWSHQRNTSEIPSNVGCLPHSRSPWSSTRRTTALFRALISCPSTITSQKSCRNESSAKLATTNGSLANHPPFTFSPPYRCLLCWPWRHCFSTCPPLCGDCFPGNRASTSNPWYKWHAIQGYWMPRADNEQCKRLPQMWRRRCTSNIRQAFLNRRPFKE